MMTAFICDEQFFAPVSSDLLDTLVGEYRLQRQKIEQVHAALTDHGLGTVITHFVAGNCHESDRHHVPSSEKLFQRAGAIKSLNSHYWDKALRMTDVLDVMPQARRDEWHKSIREMTAPEFEEESVRATLADLLASRAKFLAERVDGIFRSLSREHVTNRPEGFGKRMILNSVTNEYGLSSGTQQGHINDLRCVIAKFMGREEPHWGATGQVVAAAKRQSGEWFTLDGGALKLRVYLKGTGHLEIHPDMAWRLNAMLASIYPQAIPEQHRQPPKRKPKEVELVQKLLPFKVLDLLASMKQGYRIEKNTGSDSRRRDYNHVAVHNSLKFDHWSSDKHIGEQASAVLQSIGGVWDQEHSFYRFDYPPQPVIDLIVTSGSVPDQKSHQFYPTPEALARKAIELAELEGARYILEPSAGIGNLLQFMPKGSQAIEISELHCEVLRQRFGGGIIQGDFLKMGPCPGHDRIVMNPPFDRGQWRAHLEHAATFLLPTGRLVAILPEGARNTRDLLPGFKLEWHGPFENQFPGASVSVVILVTERTA